MAVLPANDPVHGTENGYKNYGCRCDRCRTATTEATRERRHRLGHHRPRDVYLADLRAALPPPHGTESRYVHHRCRCQECRNAANAARTARYHANLERERKYQRDYKRSRRTKRLKAAA